MRAHSRRTKILATLGPACSTPQAIEALVAAGVDAVRLNFSHGTRQDHARACELVRRASASAKRAVAVLQDLQGPKTRLGQLPASGIVAASGSTLVITARDVQAAAGLVPTTYAGLPGDVEPGERLLLDDGKISAEVVTVRGQDVVCRVIEGGHLRSHVGLHVPDAALTVPALTEKDREDVRFGCSLGVDFIALSFVRRAQDVADLKSLLAAEGCKIPVIAKIEKPQAIDNLDEIIALAEGVMVARGDLGVEASLEMVPYYQKQIISQANRAGKLVITATQMLESMTQNPVPTRAEVSDVANAILDGSDAVMLSGETAIGKFPVLTVERMAAIVTTTEERFHPFDRNTGTTVQARDFQAEVARLAAQATRDLAPKAIVVFTRSGRTARRVSEERPQAPILAFTTDPQVYQQLALYWGVVPRLIDEMGSIDALVTRGEKLLLDGGWAARGDTLLYLLGSDTSPGATNSLRIARLG